MKSIKGTKTEKNLLTAFAGESQARNRYTFYASAAKKDGYVEMQQAFEEIANQEKEHAKRLFKYLEGGEAEITASFPAGKIGSTLENLTESANGENCEHTEMYPAFAKIAEEEGFLEIAATIRSIAVAERFHERRFRDFISAIKDGNVFKKAEKTTWRCLNCGYIHESMTPPDLCPACAHPKDYFEVVKSAACKH